MFRIALFLARRFGVFTYDGVLANAPRWWPKARVEYPLVDTRIHRRSHSLPMPIGNAVDYAKMFGGKVVRA